jgi:hypothetical protein
LDLEGDCDGLLKPDDDCELEDWLPEEDCAPEDDCEPDEFDCELPDELVSADEFDEFDEVDELDE